MIVTTYIQNYIQKQCSKWWKGNHVRDRMLVTSLIICTPYKEYAVARIVIQWTLE